MCMTNTAIMITDGNVYIWNKDQAKLIEVLSGHTGTVNSVCWNPAATGEQTFASASDDGTIRMYGDVAAHVMVSFQFSLNFTSPNRLVTAGAKVRIKRSRYTTN